MREIFDSGDTPKDHIEHAEFALTGCFHDGAMVLSLDVGSISPLDKLMLSHALHIASAELADNAEAHHLQNRAERAQRN